MELKWTQWQLQMISSSRRRRRLHSIKTSSTLGALILVNLTKSLTVTTPSTPNMHRFPMESWGNQSGSKLVSMIRGNVVKAKPPTTHSDFKCKLVCCKSCTFCCQAATKERPKSLYCKQRKILKYLKGVSCVGQSSSVQHVTNIHIVAQYLSVGARLNYFKKNLGHPWGQFQGHQIVKEGYTLPFQNRPILTRSPVVISGYVGYSSR